MTSTRLRRIFRTIALGATAPAAVSVWAACGTSSSPETPDAAGPDAAVNDATIRDAGAGEAEASIIDDTDSSITWCEAGGPQLVREAGCYNYMYVPCGLPADTYVQGAPGDTSGALNRCDHVCPNVIHFDCALLAPNQASIVVGPSAACGSDTGDGGEGGSSADDASDDGAAPDEAGAQAGDGGTSAEGGGGMCVGSYVVCGCPAIGRRPRGLRARSFCANDVLGAHFAAMAHLEAASVPAFERLWSELRALHAPARILASVERARRDEIRHARVVARLARRNGGTVSAPMIRVKKKEPRSARAIAIENAVEGCVRETYGALVATWQSMHAADAGVRRMMSRIAQDETRHAALSFRIASFFDGTLDARDRRTVSRARRRALAELAREVRTEPDARLVHEAGMPSALQATRLLTALEQHLHAEERV
jgi:hypothetical protein